MKGVYFSGRGARYSLAGALSTCQERGYLPYETAIMLKSVLFWHFSLEDFDFPVIITSDLDEKVTDVVVNVLNY